MTQINNELIPQWALFVTADLHSEGYEAYLVGGCVRDLIMGYEPHDFDICTNATPEQTIEVLKKHKYAYHTVGIEFGTVTAMCNSEKNTGVLDEYEITTYRSEAGYTDSRRPDAVMFENDIHKDLSRRDFTINAMAYDPHSGELIDDYDGQLDIRNKVIKCVGDPQVRFSEDALRMLRALRFAIKYNFNIEDSTLSEMLINCKSLESISKERMTEELSKILTSGKPLTHWMLIYSDLLFEIIPELKVCYNFKQNNKYHRHDVLEHILTVVDNCKSNKFEIKLAALLHDIGKPKAYVTDENGEGHFYGHPEDSYEISLEVLKNDLRLTTEQSERVLELVRYHDMMIAPTRKSVKRALNKHGVDFLNNWFILKQADMDDHIYPDVADGFIVKIPEIKEIMQQIIEDGACFKLKDLKINGNDIMKITGTKPGKHLGVILQALLDEVIDEAIINESDILKERALELYNNMQ